MTNVNLVEAGITWQGEGPNSGRTMLLTRFKECSRNGARDNPQPCPFCDTQIKMRTSIEASYTVLAEVVSRILVKLLRYLPLFSV